MKHKKQVLEFLDSNAVMINSLMTKEEIALFRGKGIASVLYEEVNRQLEAEKRLLDKSSMRMNLSNNLTERRKHLS